MLKMLCLKGDANSLFFFVFVYIVMMFCFNDAVAYDPFMVIWGWTSPPRVPALLIVGLMQSLNFVWLC